MRYSPKLYWFAILAAVLAVPMATIVVSAGQSCDAGPAELLTEIKKAGGCGEFWFNRYQTSLQTVISAGIGAAGLFFIIQQLRELASQNAMTRQALEANTRQHEAQNLSLTAKAKFAIGLHASGAGTAMLEALAAYSDRPITPKSPDHEFIGRVAASIVDIYPVLRTKELREEWKLLKAEYDVLVAYVIARRITRDSTDFAKHLSNPPKDLIDAAARAGALNTRFVSLASKIDI